MKKLRWVLVILLIVLAVLLVADVIILWPQLELNYWNNLYENLTTDQIQKVTGVYVYGDGEFILSENEISTLVDLLNKVHLEEVGSYEYRGMATGLKSCGFWITLKNGNTFMVEPFGNSYLVMNFGRGYLEEYDVLEAVGLFHWDLDQKYRLGN